MIGTRWSRTGATYTNAIYNLDGEANYQQTQVAIPRRGRLYTRLGYPDHATIYNTNNRYSSSCGIWPHTRYSYYSGLVEYYDINMEEEQLAREFLTARNFDMTSPLTKALIDSLALESGKDEWWWEWYSASFRELNNSFMYDGELAPIYLDCRIRHIHHHAEC